MNVIKIDGIDTKAGKCLVKFGLKIGRAVVEIAFTQFLPARNACLEAMENNSLRRFPCFARNVPITVSEVPIP